MALNNGSTSLLTDTFAYDAMSRLATVSDGTSIATYSKMFASASKRWKEGVIHILGLLSDPALYAFQAG